LLGALGWVLAAQDAPESELDGVVDRLAPRATTVGHLDLLGEVSLARMRVAEGLDYERRALALDPTCISCLSTLARGLAAQGKKADALAAVRLAQGLLRHGRRSPTLEQQAREYDATQAATALLDEFPCGDDQSGGPAPGQLPAAVVKRVLQASQPALAKCYDDGRRANPGLQGKMTITFSIGADGKVRDAQASCVTLPDPGVVTCVTDVYRRLVFPPPQGGVVRKSTPVVFAP
jgi:hypothetical protein